MGRGSLNKDPSGRWSFVHDAQGPDGKRRQVRRRGFRTKKDAEAALEDSLRRARRGALSVGPKDTLGEYLARWTVTRQLAPASRERHSWAFGHLERSGLAALRLRELGPAHLDQLQAHLLARGLSGGSRLNIHAVLKAALRPLLERGELRGDLWAGVETPRRGPSPMTALSAEESLAALEALRPTRWHAPAYLAATTGLRRGELLALTWPDLRDGALTVRAATTKTARARRVLLYPDTLAVLEAWRQEQARARKLLGTPESALLFPRPDGTPWNGHRWSRLWHYVAKRLPGRAQGLRWHDWRHSHASALLAAGVELPVVAERLGHATPAVTARVYAHLLPDRQAWAVDRGGAAWQAAHHRRDQTVTTPHVVRLETAHRRGKATG